MIVLCALPTAFLQLKTNTRILTPSPLPSHSSSSSSSSSLHRKVVFSTSLDRGDVSIKVGSQVSASWAFAHLSPSINDATIDYLHTTLYDTQGGVEYTILGSFFGQAIETLRVTVGGTGGKGAAEALHISVYVQSTFSLCSVLFSCTSFALTLTFYYLNRLVPNRQRCGGGSRRPLHPG